MVLAVWLGTVALAFAAGQWIDSGTTGEATREDSFRGRGAVAGAENGATGGDGGAGRNGNSDRSPEVAGVVGDESARGIPSLRPVAEGTMDTRVWDAAAREAAVLSPGEALRWFEAVRRLPPGRRRDELLATLLGRIGTGDAGEAMRRLGAIGGVTTRESARREILRAWAGRDAAAALEWIETHREAAPRSLRAARLEAWMEGYARTDPAAALEHAVNLPGDTRDDLLQKRRMVETVVEELVVGGRIAEALAGLEKLPPGRVRNEALSELYSEWAKESPQVAAAHFLANRREGGERMAAGLVRAWAETDPTAAAGFVASLGTGDPAFEVAVSSLIERWSRYDLDGPGQWLNELPPSEEIDRAVAVFSMRASHEDPAGAMTWAESISSESRRTRVMSGVAESWKEIDPAGFEAYLESSGLDEQTVEQLQTSGNRAISDKSPRK